jgi:hypothetical protein
MLTNLHEELVSEFVRNLEKVQQTPINLMTDIIGQLQTNFDKGPDLLAIIEGIHLCDREIALKNQQIFDPSVAKRLDKICDDSVELKNDFKDMLKDCLDVQNRIYNRELEIKAKFEKDRLGLREKVESDFIKETLARSGAVYRENSSRELPLAREDIKVSCESGTFMEENKPMTD